AAEALRGVCERAAAHGLLVTLEFLPWSGIPDAATALEIVRRSDHPAATVMVDTWHQFRGSGDMSQLRAIPGAKVGSVQINDAPLRPGADLVQESLEGRLLPGEGEMPLLEMLAILDEIGARAPIGVEVFSKALDALPPIEVGPRAEDLPGRPPGTVSEGRAPHTSEELLGTSWQAERGSAERAASRRRAESIRWNPPSRRPRTPQSPGARRSP